MKAKQFTFGCLGLMVVCLFLLWLAWPTLNNLFDLEPWSFRKARFDRAGRRAAPLVAAINQYASDQGHPPESLVDLVPDYLRKVPGTGLREYPKFKYGSNTNGQTSLVWYDLGSRNDRPPTGLWVYPDGDPGHAILALTLDKSNRVVDARVDRMPEVTHAVRFDADQWRANSNRMEMVRALPGHLGTNWGSLPQLELLLGRPDGQRVLRDTPWELRIDCSWGMMNWDVFFYWPTTNYPKYIYGGDTEKIGDWAYVHE